MEHKMGSCEDVFWSAAIGGEAALFSSASVPIGTHLYSTFRLMPAAASSHSNQEIVTHPFMLQIVDIISHFFFLFDLICV